jgi:hypothetical protein
MTVESHEELGSIAKGKQAELLVFGELLKRGHQVYTPMIDIEGIDCLVDVGDGKYKEVRVKYREKNPLFQVKKFRPRDNFYVVRCLGLGSEGKLWVIPSKVFNELGTSARVEGREYIRLTIGKEGSDSYDKLMQYYGNFHQLLRGATREVREVVQRASKRIQGAHFMGRDYEYQILSILSFSAKPMTRKEIVQKVYESLHKGFSKSDEERVKTGGLRWKRNTEWAISHLKLHGLITAKAKNQYVIADAGKKFLYNAATEIVIPRL